MPEFCFRDSLRNDQLALRRWVEREVFMAAIAPPLAVIIIIAIVFYLAKRSAYKRK